jgi:uncharacterized protein with HEPN domain
MKQETTRRLLDARQAAQLIHDATASGTFDTFRADVMDLLGLVKLFEIVGESLNRARKGEPGIEGSVPHLRRFVNLRNQLVHEYDKIDYHLVWQTAEEGIPDLLGTLTNLTGNFQQGDPRNQSRNRPAASAEQRRPARQR